MLKKWLGVLRTDERARTKRGVSSRPTLEGLESRLLLYSTLGANWTYGSRITYSFVPDGTNVAGYTSNLYSTLDAKFATATWQDQFRKAAAVWEAAANINLVQVSDNGAPLGGGAYQQGDPGMGDIRISMASLPSGQLAFTFSPPPINGGSDAGDVILNSNINWQINSNYDLMAVALHEFGHALGMDHSSYSSAVMYSSYTGIKQSLTADDVAGIQSIYSASQPDAFDAVGYGNYTYSTATNITPYIDSNAQIALPDLRITTSSDNDWYYVTVPSNTTGTMTITMQSSGLSSLSPRMMIYSSSLVGLVNIGAPNVYGATLTVTATGVTPGQGFYIRAIPASSPGAVGAYGLLVNFGSQPQSPIAPPFTQVEAQLDQGGGGSGLYGKSGGSNARGKAKHEFANLRDLIQSRLDKLFGRGDFFDAAAGGPITHEIRDGVVTLTLTVNLADFPGGLTTLSAADFPHGPMSVYSTSTNAPAAAEPITPPRPNSHVLQSIDDALSLLAASKRGGLLGGSLLDFGDC